MMRITRSKYNLKEWFKQNQPIMEVTLLKCNMILCEHYGKTLANKREHYKVELQYVHCSMRSGSPSRSLAVL